jgi:hypothetical protein
VATHALGEILQELLQARPGLAQALEAVRHGSAHEEAPAPAAEPVERVERQGLLAFAAWSHHAAPVDPLPRYRRGARADLRRSRRTSRPARVM